MEITVFKEALLILLLASYDTGLRLTLAMSWETRNVECSGRHVTNPTHDGTRRNAKKKDCARTVERAFCEMCEQSKVEYTVSIERNYRELYGVEVVVFYSSVVYDGEEQLIICNVTQANSEKREDKEEEDEDEEEDGEEDESALVTCNRIPYDTNLPIKKCKRGSQDVTCLVNCGKKRTNKIKCEMGISTITTQSHFQISSSSPSLTSSSPRAPTFPTSTSPPLSTSSLPDSETTTRQKEPAASNRSAVVGGAIGGVFSGVFVTVVVVVVLWRCKKRRYVKRRRSQDDTDRNIETRESHVYARLAPTKTSNSAESASQDNPVVNCDYHSALGMTDSGHKPLSVQSSSNSGVYTDISDEYMLASGAGPANQKADTGVVDIAKTAEEISSHESSVAMTAGLSEYFVLENVKTANGAHNRPVMDAHETDSQDYNKLGDDIIVETAKDIYNRLDEKIKQ